MLKTIPFHVLKVKPKLVGMFGAVQDGRPVGRIVPVEVSPNGKHVTQLPRNSRFPHLPGAGHKQHLPVFQVMFLPGFN